MKRFTTKLCLATLPLLQGCALMHNDGWKGDDVIAKICGTLGAISFILGIIGGRATAIIVGVLLIIA